MVHDNYENKVKYKSLHSILQSYVSDQIHPKVDILKSL